jgi:hypothetical protein
MAPVVLQAQQVPVAQQEPVVLQAQQVQVALQVQVAQDLILLIMPVLVEYYYQTAQLMPQPHLQD